MKFLNILAVSALSLSLTVAHAQTEELPAGYKKGAVLLADGSRVEGFINESIRKNASLTFKSGTGEKKKTYQGSDLSGAIVGEEQFICLKGDFFKTLCRGELSFLQKASDASGKLIYNGNEAIVSGGTIGKPGDYFVYREADKQLNLASVKTLDELIRNCFNGSKEAADQARAANSDIAQLKKAVEIYNNRSK